MTTTLTDFTDWSRDWLFDAALPLWWDRGADRTAGGFHEKLAQDGIPVPAAKRIRVQARQVFVYCEAGRLGWAGPWREAVDHGLAFLLDAYRRPDGLFRTSVAAGGQPGSDEVDLYDQAFVLLALASAYAQLDRPAALLDEANALLSTLDRRFAHPIGGFRELGGAALPLRSNPHMHMLEAMLAWTATEADPRFADRARGIVDLALERMIDPETGAIGEYFDGDWNAAPGESGGLREPGHQFEWAFLLDRSDRLLGTATRPAADRLLAFGNDHGMIGDRAIFSVAAGGTPIDRTSRLWAQTERLRAMLLVGGDHAAAAQSADVLRRYLDVPIRGLWTDRITADGSMTDEAAPASSFYHIMTALTPLIA